jgi:hypothetical protein
MNVVHGIVMVVGFVATVSSQGFSDSTVCEKMFQKVRTVQNSAAIDGDKRVQVMNLIKKGLERCAAEDEVHAHLFFSQALQIMAK